MNKLHSLATPLLLLAALTGCQPLKVARVSTVEPLAAAQREVDRPDAPDKPEELPAPARPTREPQPAPPPDPAERLKALVEDLDPENSDSGFQPLRLQQVIDSTIQSYPAIQAAMREGQIAAGRQLAARGAFDLKVQAETMNMPLGFYKNYRQLAKIEQPTWAGGAVYGQYRIGDGDFQPWYGERETNEGGEFKIGAATPLLQNRAIDARRAEIAKADLQSDAVLPLVQGEMIDAVLFASSVYWSWVAAGQAYSITRELLQVAEDRNKAIARQVELGNLAKTELQQNERLIAARQAKLIESQRKLQSTAIKLSLFWRDDAGQPVIPSPALLPLGFPTPSPPRPENIESDIELAMQNRPELRDLAIQRQAATVDLAQGENETLPRLDAVIEASKDVGAPASSKGDKTPFELEAGLLFDVPMQRRKAYGKVQSAQGKLTQIAIKQQFMANKVRVDVQDAVSALGAAYERVERTRRSAELARQLVVAEYRSFELGNSDVLRIAIQEAAELDAQLLEIEAVHDYFQALAAYRAALGQR
jgi:outer membrane protein TolC